MSIPEDLAAQARQHGVALSYHSFWGEDTSVPESVLRQALQAMGVGAEAAEESTGGWPAVKVVTQGEPLQFAWCGAPLGSHWRLVPEESSGSSYEGPVRQVGAQCVLDLPADLAMGYWQLTVAGHDRACLLVVAPRRCWAPAELVDGQRWWGCTIQLYALRSSRNWGIGDFGDLRRMVDTAARHGASFVGLSPLHALFPHRPEVASPYSPSSRIALNPIYLDVQALVELSGCEEALSKLHSEEFQERLRRLRDSELVDYPAVAAAKQEMLSLLWSHFQRTETGDGSSRGSHFARFVREWQSTLGQHAVFEAVQSHLHAIDASVWGWPAWPESFRDPQGEAVAQFVRERASAVQYRLWLQWLAELQLESVQRYAKARGMGLGLYRDLAVGVNEGGSETWVQPDLYALGMRVGAPPDPLNALGQDWGLPPLNPVRLRSAGYRPFIETLRANMRHSGALRLDHVMALMRLFWIGAEGGTYVSYPLEDLLGILALESHRHQCLVIGEDLGNVAPAMRDAMRDRCLLSYRPLLFEREDDGGFRPPAQWHAQALAVVSTHDLPTLRGFWLGEDLEQLAALGLFPDEPAREQAVIQRAQDRARLLLALQHESLLPPETSVQATSLPDTTAAFVASVYAYLARTPSWLVGVQLEDVTAQLLQVNVPGTSEERFPNWRRKISVTVDDLGSNECFAAVAAVLRAERSGPAPEAAPAELPALDTARIPIATYRVQFHKGCRFEEVTRAIPYFAALGISHLYSSPYLRARPGSTHGYDIVDHAELNPEVGDEQAFERMCQTLRRHGMGQMLDLVPNHMGVLEADNAWWLEVLEHGQASPHAQTFDIEWSPAAAEMTGRVLLPVLGDHYGRVLENGELRLHCNVEHGAFELRYWDHRFPIDPATYPEIFATLPMPVPQDEGESDSHAVVASLMDAFARLPERNTPEDAARRARLRDSAIHKRTLARLMARHEWLRQWTDNCLQRLNGRVGEPASFDLMEQLLARQAYRLADWHVASDDVNYRRFFDVNTLAAIRMEQQEVFEATHARVLQWLQDGHLDALRIDHPDGLSDPQQYFERLQSRYARQVDLIGRQPRALFLVVEKILAEHEPLSHHWPVHGDTGYRFAALVNGLFVNGSRMPELDHAYTAFTGVQDDFAETAYRCKKLIIETSLFSELSWLSEALYRISRGNRRRCDFTRNRLRQALAEIAAAYPVYRTYLRVGEIPTPVDRRHIDWAVASAKRRLGGSEASVLDHVREILLGEGEAADVPCAQRARFLARWQQFTAPVMAKGVEDTAFYRHVRLVSLNDVGGDPASAGISVAAFHGANQARGRHRPQCLLSTSTHDSKRGEDLRARINVLSEMPTDWYEAVQRWAGWGELYLSDIAGVAAPCRNDIWLFFQTLVGLWPAVPPDAQARELLRTRMQDYMRKALREAKVNTTWTCPVPAYDDAMARYVDAVLRPGPNPFAEELQRFTSRVAAWGFRNSLAQLALKLTVPGVPDLYQGSELWNFSLVDPDNRRPVDFETLTVTLTNLQSRCPGNTPDPALWADLHRNIADGRIKQLVTWRLLQLRQSNPELFRLGSYLPLPLEGPSAEHAVAFARLHGDQAVIVVAARLTATLCNHDPHLWPVQAWHGTHMRAADTQPVRKWKLWRHWLTGETVAPFEGTSEAGRLDALFSNAADLPFVILVPDPHEDPVRNA